MRVRQLGTAGDGLLDDRSDLQSPARPDSCFVLADITAGQTETLSGIVRSTIDLGAAALLTEPQGGWLSVFGDIVGPTGGVASVTVAAGATLYAAGAVGPSVEFGFAGPAGTLELAGQFLSNMAASIAGFAQGQVIDIISGTINGGLLTAAGTGEVLSLLRDGVAQGTLTLADSYAAAGTIYVVADGNDGTRLLIGPSMLDISIVAPAGTAAGSRFVWGGSAGGRWSDAGAWRNEGAGGAVAPGSRDDAIVAGPLDAVLSLAGNGVATSLATQGVVALAGSFDVGTLVVGDGALDALLLTTGCAVVAGAATLQGGVLQVIGSGAALHVAGSTTVQTDFIWVTDGGRFQTSTLDLAGGAVRVDTTGFVVVGGGGNVSGSVVVNDPGLLEGRGSIRGPVINNGTMLATGGALDIFGGLSGSGLAEISSDGTLFLPNGIAATQRIAFATGGQGGTLELFASASNCSATITGFGVGDVIDIASGTVSKPAWTPGQGGAEIGTLDLGPAGAVAIELAPGLDPASASFAVMSDGVGGSAIALVPCFCEGTRLATPDGEIAVENVVPGNRLLTRGGAARRVQWVGKRTYTPVILRDDAQLRPVRISAGGLGAGVPRRDLVVSPQHALALDTSSGTRLVPAVCLVDGIRVRREPPDETVSYFHIELETHDLLIAEDLFVESFLSNGSQRRSLFHREIGVPAEVTEPCYPRLEDGIGLVDLRRHLRLGPTETEAADPSAIGRIDSATVDAPELHLEGWAVNPSCPSQPVWIEVLLNDSLYGKSIANRWRPDLDKAGARGGMCGFEINIQIPATYGHVQLRLRAAEALSSPRCRL